MAKKECGYCMQKMNADLDPRKLPCGHVFCLECMKDDQSTSGQSGYQCPECRGGYEQIDLDALPAATFEEASGDVQKVLSTLEEATAKLRCDRCKEKAAVKYCINCGELSCARHFEFHEGYYEASHEVVDVMKYAQNPSVYNSTIICPSHKEERITMACKNCYQYNCLHCSKLSTVCPESSRSPEAGHLYTPLADVEEEIQKHFKKLFEASDNKLKNIGSIEKEAWRMVDNLGTLCKQMLIDLETHSLQQIEQIEQKTKQLKEELKAYEAEKTEYVFSFVSKLTEKKEAIEEAKTSIHQFVQNRHVKELIKFKKEKSEVVTSANAINVSRCSWRQKTLSLGDLPQKWKLA